MQLEEIVKPAVLIALKELYDVDFNENDLNFQKTRKEFEGDITLVVFPFTKISKKSPEECANEIGSHLVYHSHIMENFNVVKGFLNISMSPDFWIYHFSTIKNEVNFGFNEAKSKETLLVEYSSPNTNKPLHLGHVRNNLLGFSVSEILKANGFDVKKVNIVNDRGIHICKSMIAWQKWGNGETPESSDLKGDHLVGKYYVEFDKHYKAEIADLINKGIAENDAEKQAPLILETQEMLREWEAGDAEVIDLWKKMNTWVYAGFDVTYKKMGVDFDKIYYESQTYLLGKEIVSEGLKNGVFYQKPDNSVWIDLTEEGLDHKLVLRADGTSVYITQDLGTAHERFKEFKMNKLVYVVGNEQDYHFKVLQVILQKLGFKWADGLFHLSYGMVELPHGKMKSREGTVVDADDLIDGMIEEASLRTAERGKIEGMTEAEVAELNRKIAMAALKYFILKVDPKKKMMFNPEESIDMNGNTGPFIQYSYARIQSILRKAKTDFDYDFKEAGFQLKELEKEERELIKSIFEFPALLNEAALNYSPALVCNYVYELAKSYNHFYQTLQITKEENENKRNLRLALSVKVGETIKNGMKVLGIEVPERM